MTPIEKNIKVVDEQGNEYEATYPKRARGLVKNGRARFVDEHTICLACPPNQLEENTMIENDNIVQIAEDSLNAKDILDGISKLQCQMIGNEMDSLNKSVDAVICILQNENIEEKSMSQYIKEIKEMFALRENTLQKMLAMYEKMSDDVINAEARKVEIIKSAFSEQVEKINKCDLNKEDKFAAIGDVTYQITELTDKLLFPGTTDKTKDAVIRKMACIIDSPDASESARECAMNVLESYIRWNNDK